VNIIDKRAPWSVERCKRGRAICRKRKGGEKWEVLREEGTQRERVKEGLEDKDRKEKKF